MTAPATAKNNPAPPADKKPSKTPLVLGKGPGPIDNVKIKAKVKKWQAAGGGSITVVEPASPEADGDEDVGEDFQEKSLPVAKPPAHVYLASRPGNGLDSELQAAVTPRKRVISDGHWRKSRSPPKDGRPTGWVRPAVKKIQLPKPDEKRDEPKKSPIKVPPLPKHIYAPDGTRVAAVRRRRKSPAAELVDNSNSRDQETAEASTSRPNHVDSGLSPDEPPSTAKDFGKKHEAQGQTSAEHNDAPVKKEAFRKTKDTHDDYEQKQDPSPRPSATSVRGSRSEDELRRRRKMRRRPNHSRDDISSHPPDDEHTTEKRRSRRQPNRELSPEHAERPAAAQSAPVTPQSGTPTPPEDAGNEKTFGTRVEAWLSTAQDSFAEYRDHVKSQRRRTLIGLSTSTGYSTAPLHSSKHEDYRREDVIFTKPEHLASHHGSSRRRASRRSHDDQNRSIPPGNGTRRISPSQIDRDLITVEYDESTTVSNTSSLDCGQAPHKSESPNKSHNLVSVPASIPEDEAVASVATSLVDPVSSHSPMTDSRRLRSTKREFPTVGRKLSTIVSEGNLDSTQNASGPLIAVSDDTIHPDDTSVGASPGDALGDAADTMSTMTGRSRNSTRGHLASHADLISVLSMPERTTSKTKSIVSARSIRTNKSRLATATIADLMKELQSDETRYIRELRTLVDGVIPVLLTCVLSKSEASVTAGLFSRTARKDGSQITKPVVEMGIALERLKTLHKRIPKESTDDLLLWAQTTQSVYADYVKSWRLGFQDVVVNLAPANEEREHDKNDDLADLESTIDEGMSRNDEGYVVDGDGERVDVAFLLKRPLVRLKYLAKTFKGINILRPSERADCVAARYQELVIQARRRSNEERARLEDEAAASIDPTRARDPRSLAPLSGVSIDATRCVRARDYFDMTLLHSSGQEVDCRVELLLRDDLPERGSSGDLLLCEVDKTGRWLLFPPIQLNRISARSGDVRGEIVIMVRGHASSHEAWHELLTLRTSDEEVGFEWVQMLGLDPVPHKVSRGLSFRERVDARSPSSHESSSLLSVGTGSTAPVKSRTPSPRQIEVPMGERAGASSKRWSCETPPGKSRPATPETAASSVLSSEICTVGDKDGSDAASIAAAGHDRKPRRARPPILQTTLDSWTDAESSVESPTTPTLKRSKARRYPRTDRRRQRASMDSRPATCHEEQTWQSTVHSESSHATTASLSQTESSYAPSSYHSDSTERGGNYTVWYPSSGPEDISDCSDEEDAPQTRRRPTTTKHASARQRTSSVPSMDLPSMPKVRTSSRPDTPTDNGACDDMRAESVPAHWPSSAPAVLEEKQMSGAEDSLPSPPKTLHNSTGPAAQLNASPFAGLSPPKPSFRQHRRTSSPLKHEYQPSTCTGSSEECSETSSDDSNSTCSDESSEDGLEADDVGPGRALPPAHPDQPFSKPPPPEPEHTTGKSTLTPSQSASQIPSRTVPPASARPAKAIASIFAWSDTGIWDPLHPNECSIVITPGLIEAFEVGPEHTNDTTNEANDSRRPLIALELTPLVPLRRGTAVDISIRSPPTDKSRIRTTAHIMFRVRSPEECESLYNLINRSRINNPTYMALQNARGPYAEDTWAAAMDRRNAERTEESAAGNGSWWGSLGRRSSYRAKSTRAISTSAGTMSSVNTIGSAFSALKRLGSGGRLFNGRSSLHSSKQDSRSRSSDSLDGQVESSAGTWPRSKVADATLDAHGMPLGIMNTKIRLYVRESQQKWRDMGAARLCIMRPTPPASPKAGAYVRQGQGPPGQRNPEEEKRIVVFGKTRGEMLLDVTLSESCFERVARTGIAVSVWEDTVGTNAELGGIPAVGGVAATKARVYMIQMKSEREAAYCFSLLGKLRY